MPQVDARGGVLVGATFASGLGTHLNLQQAGTISVNPPVSGSIAADGVGTWTGTVTVTGAKVGDLIFLFPPDTLGSTLASGLYIASLGGAVTAADTVTIRFLGINETAAAATIDEPAREWAYLLFEKTS